jgi:hypothetical protein
MAAAVSLVDGSMTTAVRTRGAVKERPRASAGGAYGNRLPREAREKRSREEGRLDEQERSELLFVWGGNESALGCRSLQGAIEDKLLRSPPRVGPFLARQIQIELTKKGREGMSRDKLVEVIALEHPKSRTADAWAGATKYEVRRELRAMVGARRVEFFTAEVTRKSPVTDAPESLQVEMVRLAPAEMRLALVADAEEDEGLPPGLSRAERRWARQDRELEAEHQRIHCRESTNSGGSRTPPVSSGSRRGESAQRALVRMAPGHRRVIERAYGGFAAAYAAPWREYGEEVACVAPLCPSVERARRELVRESSTPDSRETVDRSTFAADAMRAVLDAAPEGEADRARWQAARSVFITKVRGEAEKMLKDAVEAYRSAREV